MPYKCRSKTIKNRDLYYFLFVILYKLFNKKLEEDKRSFKSEKIRRLFAIKPFPLILIAEIDMLIIVNMERSSTFSKEFFEKHFEDYKKAIYSPLKDVAFTAEDIKELSDWAFKNWSFFCNLHPYSIAISRYSEYDNNLLTVLSGLKK